MQKAAASEVVATAHGLVVIGSKGPGTRVWFLPAKKAHASERLNEFMLPWEPPRESPAARCRAYPSYSWKMRRAKLCRLRFQTILSCFPFFST